MNSTVAASPVSIILEPRGDHGTVELRELELGSVPCVALPSAPLRWQESHPAKNRIPEPSEWFEVHDAGWRLQFTEKLPPSDRPDPAFRRLCPMDNGIFMIDDLGNAKGLGPMQAAAIRYDRKGRLVAKAGFSRDVYRLGVHPLGRTLIAMSSDCVLHGYDDDLRPILESSLRESPQVHALQRRFEIADGQLKNHLRCVALSQDRSRYLFTAVDEAWCFDLNGRAVWGVKLPIKEGWRRIEASDEGFGTSSGVQKALALMHLSRPATAAQIKQRYRELAMQWHPDRHHGDAFAQARMTALNAAVEVLAAEKDLARENADGRIFSEQDHFEFDMGGERFTLGLGLGGDLRFACDWIYAASFAAHSNSVYLAGYSGRVIVLNQDGEAISRYGTGSPPNRIIDTGEYLYILTDTRLYVIRGDSLEALIDTCGSRELVLSRNGFGLLESKRLSWFSKEGHQLATVLSNEPIRRLYRSRDGLVLETRQRRAVIAGAPCWWD